MGFNVGAVMHLRGVVSGEVRYVGAYIRIRKVVSCEVVFEDCFTAGVQRGEAPYSSRCPEVKVSLRKPHREHKLSPLEPSLFGEGGGLGGSGGS